MEESKSNTLSFLPLISENSSSDTSKLQLNRKSLRSLASVNGKSNVVVVSVVGQRGSGKSLLLGYISRYLEAIEKEDPDWMGWDTPHKPVLSNQWESNKSPNHVGIWIHHRPFVIKVCQNFTESEITVLLLYTQCLHPETRTNDKIFSILGLSMQISSSTIINIRNDIREQVLHGIYDAIKLTISNSVDTPVRNLLHNLYFLVRDWNHPSEFPYGFNGGNKFFATKKMIEKEGHTKKSSAVRKILNSAFENITTCLLPFPGNSVADAKFRGSIKEVDLVFAENLEELIGSVINLQCPAIRKDNAGNFVSLSDWTTKLEDCLNRFNNTEAHICSDIEMLKTMGVKSSLNNAELKALIKNSMKEFYKSFNSQERKYKSKKFLDTKILNEINRKSRNQVISRFRETVCEWLSADEYEEEIEKQPEIKLFEECLTKKITLALEDIKIQHKNKQKQFFADLSEELLMEYRHSLEDLTLKSAGSSETLLRKQSAIISRTMVQEYTDKLAMNVQTHTNEHSQLIDDFKKQLKDVEESLLNPSLESIPEKQQQQNNELYTSNISLNLTKFQDNGSNVFNSTLTLTKKQNNLEAPYYHKQNAAEEKQDANKKAGDLIEDLKKQHYQILNSNISENSKELHKLHKHNFSISIEKFENAQIFPAKSQDFNRYRSILEGVLCDMFESIQLQKRNLKKCKQNDILQALKQATNSYETQLREHAKTKLFDSQCEMRKVADDLKIQIMKNLKSQFPDEGTLSNEINDTFSEVFQKVWRENQRHLESLKNNIAQFKRECKASYIKTLKEYIHEDKRLSSSLITVHNNTKTSILNDFRGRFATECSKEYLQNQTLELDEIMETEFRNLEDIYNKKYSKQIECQKRIISEAVHHYREEMRKIIEENNIASLAEMETLHEYVRNGAVEKLKKSVGADEEGIKLALDNAFIEFKDQCLLESSVEPAIGIDLGTTFSCVSVYTNKTLTIIPNSSGKCTTASYVRLNLDDDGDLVGDAAKETAFQYPETTIFDAKRLIGRKYSDKTVQDDCKMWPFSVVDDGSNIPMIKIGDKRIHPEAISARLLKQLKLDAEAYLGKKISKAVITVPAYFGDSQRQATIDAGEIAGLKVLTILNEPVAAALAYKLQYPNPKTQSGRKVLIFDLGGGTFDVAVVQTNQGKVEVLATGGDSHLGGEDFDKNILDYCAAEFKKACRIDLFHGKDSEDKTVRDDVRRKLKRLQGECERKKIALTTCMVTEIVVDRMHDDKELRVPFTKTIFENINQPLFDRTMQIVEKNSG